MREVIAQIVERIQDLLEHPLNVEVVELFEGVFELKSNLFSQPVYYRTLTSSQYQRDLSAGFTIWEDEWMLKTDIVLSRLLSLLGSTRRIYGRNTKVIQIHQPEADQFLNKNHLKGAAKGKLKLALTRKGQLAAVAVFSKGVSIDRGGEKFQSFELIRHCNALNTTVVGGLSKLIKHFIEIANPDDLMTYAESGLSDGEVFEKLGFKYVDHTDPINFKWDPASKKRVYASRSEREKWSVEELNTQFPFQIPGNQKYLLLLKSTH